MAVEMSKPELLPTGHTLDPNTGAGLFVTEPSIASHRIRIDFNEIVDGAATPPEVLLGTLNHPLLRLRNPLRLEVRREGESVGVWSEDLEQLGTGAHLTAALMDIQQTLIEGFLTLEANPDDLGPGMQRLWQEFNARIERRGHV